MFNKILTEEFQKVHKEGGSLSLDYSKFQVFPIPLKDNNTIAFAFNGKYAPKTGADQGSFLAKLFVKQEDSEPYHIFKK